MTAYRHDAGALAAALAQRAPSLAAELLPAGRRHGPEWLAGSLAGEPGRSLAVRLFGTKAGVWSDFATGERGDALDLVAAVLFGGKLRDALDWARTWLGLDSGAAPLIQRRSVPIPEAAPDDAERTARARKAWMDSGPVPGTPAAAYLSGRGLPHLVQCPALRWCSAATHPEGGRHPALIAMVQDVNGDPIAVHRTYLTPTGTKVRHLSPNKATLGPFAGGAVRLHQAGPELVVGEGIESSASAGLILDRPAWAALSTSGLLRLLLPSEVRRVVIAADHDANGAGQAAAAAAAAAARWTGERRAVRIATPDRPGQDFSDILQDRAQCAAEAAHG